MNKEIKELRQKSNMTQKQFAEAFDIPISTLRKWEQGESNPPAYIVKLIKRLIKISNNDLKLIKSKNRDYYYDDVNNIIYDSLSNGIKIKYDLSLIKPQNLPIYLDQLFDNFYTIQNGFDNDCYYDQKEDIIWSSKR